MSTSFESSTDPINAHILHPVDRNPVLRLPGLDKLGQPVRDHPPLPLVDVDHAVIGGEKAIPVDPRLLLKTDMPAVPLEKIGKWAARIPGHHV